MAYTDPDRTEAILPSTNVQLDQKVWMELKADGLDENMVLVTDSCWATDQPAPTGSLRYDLVIKGCETQRCARWLNLSLWLLASPCHVCFFMFLSRCPNPADQTVQVEGNGVGTSNYFSFNMFQFSGKTGDVFLHCRLQLCVGQSNTCEPVCPVYEYIQIHAQLNMEIWNQLQGTVNLCCAAVYHSWCESLVLQRVYLRRKVKLLILFFAFKTQLFAGCIAMR